MENLIVNGVYQHINNGGVSFGVTQDELGVAVEIEARHFGNITGKTKLYVTRESLEKLGSMFLDAADVEGLKECDYFKSEGREIDKETGNIVSSEVLTSVVTSNGFNKVPGQYAQAISNAFDSAFAED